MIEGQDHEKPAAAKCTALARSCLQNASGLPWAELELVPGFTKKVSKVSDQSTSPTPSDNSEEALQRLHIIVNSPLKKNQHQPQSNIDASQFCLAASP